ncbi:MAG: sulfite exporter TauE/SafE family protein [Chlamydiia bacterium]|nr:sulfite exporter TauE/SafE family protein [Chlamydiia bacterium]
MMIEILAFAAVGILAGFSSGLLGIGGGVITVPCLVLILTALGFPKSGVMHVAVGTSLAAMVFNTLSASYTHYIKKGVLFSIVKPMFLGAVFGAIIGATVASFLSSHFLKLLFASFEIILGLRFLLPQKRVKKERALPSFWILSGISTCVTAISTVLGIGGGMINVPILTHFGLPIKKAIGTSSALSFLISFWGAISFLILGIHASNAPHSIGFLYIPAFLSISIVSFLVAPLGAHLAHHLHGKILQKIFGAVLIATGLIMMLKG